MYRIDNSDLARSMILRKQVADLKGAAERHASEMTLGRTTDPGQKLRGDFTALSGVQRALAQVESHATVVAEANLHFTAMQNALDKVHDVTTGASARLLSINTQTQSILLQREAETIWQEMGTVISMLNAQVAGRTLFAGIDTDGSAIMDRDAMLAALEADIALAGATTAADVETVVTSWFAAGNAYLGSDTELAPYRLAPGDTMAPPPTAADPALQEILKGMAMMALLSQGLLPGDDAERFALTQAAASTMLAAQPVFFDLRAAVGIGEAQIDKAEVRLTNERVSLQRALSDLIAVDPYEAAVKLEETQSRLEALFAITARLSRLSLSDYLR
jgi:flagellar hook-associated protein 3 FlgL